MAETRAERYALLKNHGKEIEQLKAWLAPELEKLFAEEGVQVNVSGYLHDRTLSMWAMVNALKDAEITQTNDCYHISAGEGEISSLSPIMHIITEEQRGIADSVPMRFENGEILVRKESPQNAGCNADAVVLDTILKATLEAALENDGKVPSFST